MSALDEFHAAAKEVAALLKDHYMLPNTWPESRRFLAAVEALALEGQALDTPRVADQQEQGAPRADGQRPVAPVVPVPEQPARRAP